MCRLKHVSLARAMMASVNEYFGVAWDRSWRRSNCFEGYKSRYGALLMRASVSERGLKGMNLCDALFIMTPGHSSLTRTSVLQNPVPWPWRHAGSPTTTVFAFSAPPSTRLLQVLLAARIGPWLFHQQGQRAVHRSSPRLVLTKNTSLCAISFAERSMRE